MELLSKEIKRKMKHMKNKTITVMLSLMLVLGGCSCSTQATPPEPVAPVAATAEPAVPAATDREQEGSKDQEGTAAPAAGPPDTQQLGLPDPHLHYRNERLRVHGWVAGILQGQH